MKGDPFMTGEDFHKAELNRKRQIIIYPTTMEETDDSKQRRRSYSAQFRAVTEPAKRRLQPTYNPVTHRFTFH